MTPLEEGIEQQGSEAGKGLIESGNETKEKVEAKTEEPAEVKVEKPKLDYKLFSRGRPPKLKEEIAMADSAKKE